MKSAFDWQVAEKMFSSGDSVTVIASALGCSDALVRQWAKRTGKILPHHGFRVLCAVDYPEIEKRLKNGDMLRDIAEDFHVHIETIRKFAVRRCIPYSKPCVKFRPKIVGGTLDRSGYILLRVPVDSEYGYLIRANTRGDSYGYAPLHRMRMHDKLGRKLYPNEVVHHIDGDIYNNSPANLAVYESNAEHLKESLKGKIPNWTPEGKARMVGRPKKNQQ